MECTLRTARPFSTSSKRCTSTTFFAAPGRRQLAPPGLADERRKRREPGVDLGGPERPETSQTRAASTRPPSFSWVYLTLVLYPIRSLPLAGRGRVIPCRVPWRTFVRHDTRGPGPGADPVCRAAVLAERPRVGPRLDGLEAGRHDGAVPRPDQPQPARPHRPDRDRGAAAADDLLGRAAAGLGQAHAGRPATVQEPAPRPDRRGGRRTRLQPAAGARLHGRAVRGGPGASGARCRSSRSRSS